MNILREIGRRFDDHAIVPITRKLSKRTQKQTKKQLLTPGEKEIVKKKCSQPSVEFISDNAH